MQRQDLLVLAVQLLLLGSVFLAFGSSRETIDEVFLPAVNLLLDVVGFLVELTDLSQAAMCDDREPVQLLQFESEVCHINNKGIINS